MTYCKFIGEAPSERPRHHIEEDIATPVALASHATPATQDDDVAHLIRHIIDGCKGFFFSDSYP